MAGIGSLLFALSGQPDPERQLAQMLSGQQQPGQQPPQGAAPPAAAPPSAGGAGADPNAPAAAPNAPVAPGNLPPNSGPQPQALQSSPDMAASYNQLANPPNNIMSLYVQMDQRNRAIQGINSALATIAANHSPPSMRQAIMQGIGGAGGDAGATMGNLMSLYQMQQGMAAQGQLLGQAPAIAAKLGMDEGTVRAEILAGRGPDLIKNLEPTDMQKNYNWAHQIAAQNNPGASPAEIDNAAQGILLGMGGGMAGADARDRLRAMQQWKANPANAGQPTPAYMLDDQKFKLYTADQADAKSQFNGINDSLSAFVNKMADVSNNPALDKVAGSAVTGAVRTWVPNSPEKQVYDDMGNLGDTAKDMASRGGPKGLGQNLKTLGSSPGDFQNLNYQDYRGQVMAPRMQQALTAQANAYGASGQLSIMPGYLQQYLDPMYKPGGQFDPGGGFKPFTPSTDKNLKQPNATTIAAFKNDMERYGPKHALKSLEDQGFDTSGLR